MPKCPCDKITNGKRSYHCDMLGCKMFPHFCRKFLDDIRFRELYLHGQGPTQKTEEQLPQESLGLTASAAKEPPMGPGTELLRMLKTPVKILSKLPGVKKIGCGGMCSAYAEEMNAWGVAGCRERMDEIVDHLEAQAKGLGMPFSRRMAASYVKRAIRRAEKKERLTADA